MIKQELLDILACPQCKGTIDYHAKDQKILCKKCKLKFSVIDNDIPNMLIEEAQKF